MNLDQEELVVQMYEKRMMPMRFIAKELNISIGSVFNCIKKYGIKTRPNYGVKGWKQSEAVRKRISEVHKGKIVSEETRRKISEGRKLKGAGHKKKAVDGYICLYYPNYPAANKDGYILEHRYIMERKIGRYLRDDEVVHHINHIRDDNRIENLQLMTFKEHSALHMKERWDKKKGEMTYQ